MLQSTPVHRWRGAAAIPWSRPALLLRVIVVAALTVMPGGRSALAAYGGIAHHPALFGSREVQSSQLSLFPKWRGALIRYFDERKLETAPCHATTFNKCRLREWTGFLDSLRDADRMAQIRMVNHYLNEHPYITDMRNYEVEDYWATPRQFLSRDGDCEDYAIAKYFSLRSLGFPPDSLRIVVLQDLNLHAAHAILVVYMEGRALVLDNQSPTVVDARTIHHYRPIYSINEQHWWLHRL